MTQPKRKKSKLIRFLMRRNEDHFKNTSERRQIIALMFKIAFLEAMALSLILPTVSSTGEIPTLTKDNIASVKRGLLLTTSSNTPISTGIGVAFTPITSIKFTLVGYTGSYLSGTQGTDGSFNVYIYFTTSGIPSQGSAPGGSDIQMDATNTWARQNSGIANFEPFSLDRTNSTGFNPQVLNTPAWWYIAVAWGAGGSGINIVLVQITVEECLNC